MCHGISSFAENSRQPLETMAISLRLRLHWTVQRLLGSNTVQSDTLYFVVEPKEDLSNRTSCDSLAKVYISYKDKRDAEEFKLEKWPEINLKWPLWRHCLSRASHLQDAVKYMDGEKIDGQKVNVSRAEGRPPIRSGPGGPSSDDVFKWRLKRRLLKVIRFGIAAP